MHKALHPVCGILHLHVAFQTPSGWRRGSGPNTHLLLFLPNRGGPAMGCCPPPSMGPCLRPKVGRSFLLSYLQLFSRKSGPPQDRLGLVVSRDDFRRHTDPSVTENALVELLRLASAGVCVKQQGLVLATKRDLWQVGGCLSLQTFLRPRLIRL